ncbi:MAG: hypothetical protein HBSAPP01_11510 [Candidatus Brocadia sapporoensis]|nr:MAG: hypothetical protein HBSAPP01_11510 [Candidatus Brocadia sapporoensis]
MDPKKSIIKEKNTYCHPWTISYPKNYEKDKTTSQEPDNLSSCVKGITTEQ